MGNMRAQTKRVAIILGFVVVFLSIATWLYSYQQHDILLLVLSLSVILPIGYLVLERLVQRNELLRVRQEAMRSELELLKSQINPHFFFNTLNSLYALSVAGSPEAPQMILTLSDLMRFTIYEGKRDHVPLHQELAYLKNYVSLQQMRFGEKLQVSFDVNVSDDQFQIPPLLLIVLLENAFKHGVASKVEAAWVKVGLHVDADQVLFSVANNHQVSGRSISGIGLANLKRRLALIYPRKHQLDVEQDNELYRVRLELQR